MKNNVITFLAIIMVFFIAGPSLIAQEKKEEKKIEKRVKIVTVDESGEKVVIDTVITDDFDLEGLDLPENLKDIHMNMEIDEGDFAKFQSKDGNVYIMKKGDKDAFTITTIDVDDKDLKWVSEDDVIIMKKGDKESFSFITIDEEDTKDGHNIVKSFKVFDGDTLMARSSVMIVGAGEENIHTHEALKELGKGHIWISAEKGGKGVLHVSVDEDGKKIMKTIDIMTTTDDLEEGEQYIIIKSADGEKMIKIKGDAVIRIKDGKVIVEEGEEMDVDITVTERKKEVKKVKKEKK